MVFSVHAAAGPTFLAAEYEHRLLRVGSIGSHPAGSAAPRHSKLALTYTLYEFMHIDAIFDQPLFFNSASSRKEFLEDMKHAAATSSSSASSSSSSSPLSSAASSILPLNHSHVHLLDQALLLSCQDGVNFTFESSTSYPVNNNWSQLKGQVMYALDAPSNTLRHIIHGLFDPMIDQHDHTTHPTRNVFNTQMMAQHDASKLTRPNILSLLLPISYTQHGQTHHFLTPGQTPDFKKCTLQYQNLRSRVEQVKQLYLDVEQANQIDIIHEWSDLAAITNRKGQESKHLMNVPLTQFQHQHQHQPHSMIRKRTMIQAASNDSLINDIAPIPIYDVTQEKQKLLKKHELTAKDFDTSTIDLNGDEDPFARSSILLDVGSGVKFLSIILKPVVNGVLKPAVKGAVDLMVDNVMGALGDQLFYSVTEETSPDLSAMLGSTVQANVSNILIDSITYAMTKTLVLCLNEKVAPYVSNRLIKELPAQLHHIIHIILERKIPERLERTLPVIIHRVTSLTLTHSLVRSIPHSVVPAVFHSLGGLNTASAVSRPKTLYEICMQCYMQSVGAKPPQPMAPPDLFDGYKDGPPRPGANCGACPTSTFSMYYGIYHSAYFTGYYAEYYGEYYSQALQETDKAMYEDIGGPGGKGEKDEDTPS